MDNFKINSLNSGSKTQFFYVYTSQTENVTNVIYFHFEILTDVTDTTLGESGLWLGTQTRACGTAILAKSFFWLRPMGPWTAGF